MPGKRSAPALIVGGGIGGLAASLALARIGWPSIVAERRAAWSEAGAGIQLSPNGIHVLKVIGVAQRLRPQAGCPREIVVRDGRSGCVLQRLPLGDWIAARHGAPYWQVHRRDLQAALLEAVAAEPLVRVVQHFEAISFAEEATHVRVVARDGRRLEGALLVGADGVFSRLRQQLFDLPAPRFSGRTASRSVFPAIDADGMDPIDRATAGVWLARGAHVVHYPVRAGREIAAVVIRTEDWRTRGWSEPASAADIEGAIATVAPSLARALGQGREWRRWALFELDPLKVWSKGRVTLLGDAAHPTLPFLAQGGSLALEDAATLAACLAHVDGDGDIVGALDKYQRERSRRSQRVVAAARRNGMIFHLGGMAAAARNATMRLIPGERVMAGYDWVYGWRPEVL